MESRFTMRFCNSAHISGPVLIFQGQTCSLRRAFTSQERRPRSRVVIRLVRRDDLQRVREHAQQLALEAVEQTSQQEILRWVLFPAPPQIYFPKHQRAGGWIKPCLKVRKLAANCAAPLRILDDSHLFARPGRHRGGSEGAKADRRTAEGGEGRLRL
jgi:hypothetical protein